MAAKNKVIAGDYEGGLISSTFGVVSIQTGFLSSVELNKKTVEEYEVMDETKKKSVVSAVGRAFVGGALIGPAGLFAGLTAKSKGTHVIAIQFKDGKKSLLEVNDKIYSNIIKKVF